MGCVILLITLSSIAIEPVNLQMKHQNVDYYQSRSAEEIWKYGIMERMEIGSETTEDLERKLEAIEGDLVSSRKKNNCLSSLVSLYGVDKLQEIETKGCSDELLLLMKYFDRRAENMKQNLIIILVGNCILLFLILRLFYSVMLERSQRYYMTTV